MNRAYGLPLINTKSLKKNQPFHILVIQNLRDRHSIYVLPAEAHHIFLQQLMPYNPTLANRIRERLADLPNMEEIAMMGGLAFMYNQKMCVGVIGDEMMCRIDPAVRELALEKRGCRQMDFTGRPMKGFVLVDVTGMRSQQDFEYWIGLCLDYNPKAKSSKKK